MQCDYSLYGSELPLMAHRFKVLFISSLVQAVLSGLSGVTPPMDPSGSISTTVIPFSRKI